MHHEELSHIKLSCVEFETGLTLKANMPKLFGGIIDKLQWYSGGKCNCNTLKCMEQRKEKWFCSVCRPSIHNWVSFTIKFELLSFIWWIQWSCTHASCPTITSVILRIACVGMCEHCYHGIQVAIVTLFLRLAGGRGDNWKTVLFFVIARGHTLIEYHDNTVP